MTRRSLHAVRLLWLVLPWLVLPWIGPPMPAQGAVELVAPGREFRHHKLLSPGQTDEWKLEVEADEMLWCIVETTAFDPILELVDAAGNVLVSDDGEGTRSEVPWFRARARGEMAFRVRPFRGSGGGQYSFWLHRFTNVRMGSNGEARATFGREQWRHFRIELHAGDVLVPTVIGDGRLTMVFDETGRHLPAVLGGYRAAHDGDHFVRVEGAEDRACQVITQLARQRAWPGESGANDTVPAGGFDLWRVPVRPGAVLLLDLQMPAAAMQVDLVDDAPHRDGPCFRQVDHLDKGGRVRRYYTVVRDGEAELRLRNQNGVSAPYVATITVPERELPLGVPEQGMLGLRAGAIHRFTAAIGQLVHVSVESSAFDARVAVWDPKGNVIAHLDDRAPTERDADHTFLVPASGDYRLFVWSDGGSGEYGVRAEAVAVPELSLGHSLPVSVACGGTAHVHVSLRAGQEVWLAVSSRMFDAGLTVLDPAGDAGFVCDGGGIGGNVLVAYRAAHTGVHTLQVRATSGSGDGEVKALAP